MPSRSSRSRITERLSLLLRLGNDRTFPRPDLKVLAKQLRVAVTPRNAMLKAKLTNGAVVYGRNRAGAGGRAVYIYGDKYEPEFEHLDRLLDDTGVYIEVGANTGKHSIKAAKHFGDDGVVIAIEPNPDVLSILNRSVQANRFSTLRLRNFCVGERKSSGVLWMNNRMPVMFSLAKNDEDADGISTLTLTLDELFAWEGLDRLDFLKICAEGFEGQVVEGGRATIGKYRPIVQIEDATVEVPIEEPGYTCFKPPSGSISKTWIPNENPKLEVAKQLGWNVVSQ